MKKTDCKSFYHGMWAAKTVLSGAGAATSDIIEQYVSTIKTLREVDPTGAPCPPAQLVYCHCL